MKIEIGLGSLFEGRSQDSNYGSHAPIISLIFRILSTKSSLKIVKIIVCTHNILGSTGASDSNSSGKELTAVSTVTWIRIPVTGELTFRHRQKQRTDTWQHVTSLDHFCGAMIPLYNSKKIKIYILGSSLSLSFLSLMHPLKNNSRFSLGLFNSKNNQNI